MCEKKIDNLGMTQNIYNKKNNIMQGWKSMFGEQSVVMDLENQYGLKTL